MPRPTPAASFRRGDTVWLVFDSTRPLDLEPIRAKGGAIIGEVSRMPLEKGQAIRIRLNRPLMHSLTTDERSAGASWTLSFADKVQTPPQPLTVVRNITDPALANVAVPLANPGLLHRLVDPDAGDTLLVVTAPPPVRGFIKRQDFVDFALLEFRAWRRHPPELRRGRRRDRRRQGHRRQARRADAVVGRRRRRARADGGASAVRHRGMAQEPGRGFRPAPGRADRRRSRAPSPSSARRRGSNSPASTWRAACITEAKGVTEAALSDPNPKNDESVALMVHAVASILIDRPEQGLKDLANPAIGSNYDSQIVAGAGLARQGKWADAREKFKNVEFAIASLPLELQRIVTMDAMRASLEVKDYAGAAKRRAELDVIGIPPDMKPAVAVLRGRLAEALGQDRDALDEYKFAVDSDDRKAAAEAKLLEIALKQKRDEIKQDEA